MNAEGWSLVIQIVTAAISLGGLVAVVVSLQQVNRSLKANAIARIYEEIHKVHHVFIDHPDLRPYFFHNEPLVPDNPEYLRCRGIAEMFLDIFEHIYQLRGQAFRRKDENWVRYIKHMCDSSAFLCAYLQENLGLVEPPELRALIAERLEHRRSQEQNQREACVDSIER